MNEDRDTSRSASPKDRAASSSTGYIPRLESLRGIGALMVAGVHCAQASWAPDRTLLNSLREGDWFSRTLGFLYRVFCNGQGALITFFVISGFVLARTMERGPDKLWPAAKRFFVARVFRIYPAIFSTVLVFTLVYWGFNAAIPGVTAEAYSAGSVLRNLLLLETSIDGVMWSLQLEVIAVVMIFAAVRLQRRWRFTVLVLAIILTVLSFYGPWAHLFGREKHFGWIFAFAFGILLQCSDSAPVRRLSPRAATGLFLGAVLVFFGTRPISPHWAPFLETCAAAVMIRLLAYGPPMNVARVLDWSFLRFYGQISYSFYVLHPLSLIVLWNIPGEIAALRKAGVPSVAIAFCFTVASTIAITPLSWLSWRFVELPGIGLGRRFVGGPKTFKAVPVPLAP